MAFGRLAQRSGPQPMADINMTPLIDVMLVLLVIFIIAAPLMASSLRLDLPRAPATARTEVPRAIVLALDAEGQAYWESERDAEPLTREALRERIRSAARAQPGADVQLRADRRVPYGQVAELIGLIQEAGLTRIGFATESTPASRAGAPAPGTAPPR